MQVSKVTSVLTLAAVVMLTACGKQEEAAAPAAVPVAAPAPAAEPVVKIGHVAPLSGAIAHLGKDNEYGARMAIEELNAAGVMLDGKKVKLELMEIGRAHV